MRLPRFLLMVLASLIVLSGCGSTEVIEQQSTATAGSAIAATRSSTTTTEAEPSSTAVPISPTTVARPPLVDGVLAPDLTFELDDESTLRLVEAYEPVVVFFWATWCHNCHEMMPFIDRMSADYEGSATVVAVARLSPLHEIENDVIEYLPSGAARWVFDDDTAISEAFRVPGNPVTILVVGGIETNRWLGLTPVTDIQDRLEEVLGLYE